MAVDIAATSFVLAVFGIDVVVVVLAAVLAYFAAAVVAVSILAVAMLF